jgi:hypothetical protein
LLVPILTKHCNFKYSFNYSRLKLIWSNFCADLNKLIRIDYTVVCMFIHDSSIIVQINYGDEPD